MITVLQVAFWWLCAVVVVLALRFLLVGGRGRRFDWEEPAGAAGDPAERAEAIVADAAVRLAGLYEPPTRSPQPDSPGTPVRRKT